MFDVNSFYIDDVFDAIKPKGRKQHKLKKNNKKEKDTRNEDMPPFDVEKKDKEMYVIG